MKFAVDYYLLDAAILGMGLFAFALIIERAKSLYFTYSIDADKFMSKLMKLVEEDKVEEGITYCAANEKKPLAHVMKRILERSDRDDAAIEASLDIAAGEVAPGRPPVGLDAGADLSGPGPVAGCGEVPANRQSLPRGPEGLRAVGVGSGPAPRQPDARGGRIQRR